MGRASLPQWGTDFKVASLEDACEKYAAYMDEIKGQTHGTFTHMIKYRDTVILVFHSVPLLTWEEDFIEVATGGFKNSSTISRLNWATRHLELTEEQQQKSCAKFTRTGPYLVNYVAPDGNVHEVEDGFRLLYNGEVWEPTQFEREMDLAIPALVYAIRYPGLTGRAAVDDTHTVVIRRMLNDVMREL